MPIRLSNTDEWNSHFVRGLKGPYKAFWFWLKSACDCAGVWDIDIDMARMRTGFYDITQDEAEAEFKNKIIKLECGEKWYIVGFIEDQHKTTTLNYQNTYHRGVINILAKHGLCDTEFNVLSVQNTKNNKALQRALEDAKGNIKYKVKDKVILNDKDFFKTKEENTKKTVKKSTKSVPKTTEKPKTFITPLVTAFRDFREMRTKTKKPLTERAAGMIHAKLEQLAPGDDELKIKILNKSTLKCWDSVYPYVEDEDFIQAGPGSKANTVLQVSNNAKFTG